jgi:hypothetical protein
MRPSRLVLLCVLLGAASVLGGEPKLALSLWTHGGPPGSDQFLVKLAPSRHLSVSHFSRPITPSGMTETKHSVELTPDQFDRLISLALDATDFSDGCGVVADGTSADLAVNTGSGSAERTCTGASKWPQGSKTKSFLDALNTLLPRNFNVY